MAILFIYLSIYIYIYVYAYICICSKNSINFIVMINWSSWYPQSCCSSFGVGHSGCYSPSFHVHCIGLVSCTLCWSFCSFTLGSLPSMCIAPAFDSCTTFCTRCIGLFVLLHWDFSLHVHWPLHFSCTSSILSHILHWFFCIITLRLLPSVIFYLLYASFPCWLHSEVLISLFEILRT